MVHYFSDMFNLTTPHPAVVDPKTNAVLVAEQTDYQGVINITFAVETSGVMGTILTYTQNLLGASSIDNLYALFQSARSSITDETLANYAASKGA